MELKTVGRYNNSEEAHLARIELELHGLDAVIFDEHIVQLDWLQADAYGGMRLQVVEEDVEDAVKILREARKEKIARDLVFEANPCPACGEMAAKVDRKPATIAFISALILQAPVPFLCFGRQLVCQKCKATRSAKTNRLGPALQFFAGLLIIWGGFLLLTWLTDVIVPHIPVDRTSIFFNELFSHSGLGVPGWWLWLPGSVLLAIGVTIYRIWCRKTATSEPEIGKK